MSTDQLDHPLGPFFGKVGSRVTSHLEKMKGLARPGGREGWPADPENLLRKSPKGKEILGPEEEKLIGLGKYES